MLEVIGAGNPDYDGQDWGSVWANSPESKGMSEELDNIISSRRSAQTEGDAKDDDEEVKVYGCVCKAPEQESRQRAYNRADEHDGWVREPVA